MKLLLDFLPILLFFATFKYAEKHADAAAGFATEHFGLLVSGGAVSPAQAPVLLATLVVILATLLQVVTLKLRREKVHTMLWVSFALVTVLGGMTVWFQSETFIKWKPTVLYWIMGLVLWSGPVLFGKDLLRVVIGDALKLPARIWRQMNLSWIVFFALMGVLNLWVAYTYSTGTWATFKMIAFGMTLVFTVAQVFYVSRYIEEGAPAAGDAGRPADRAE